MGGTMSQSELKPEQLPTASALKPVLMSALILFSGIIIGAGLTLIITGDSGTQKSLPPGPEYMSGRMVERIVRELKLSPEQHEQLEPIIQKRMKAMDDIRSQARPQINNELKLMNEEITAILDEGQKKIWEDKVKKMQEHFTRMRQRRGSGDGRKGRRDPNSQPRRGERHRDDPLRRPPEMPPANTIN
jgi:hypothetical protein